MTMNDVVYTTPYEQGHAVFWNRTIMDVPNTAVKAVLNSCPSSFVVKIIVQERDHYMTIAIDKIQFYDKTDIMYYLANRYVICAVLLDNQDDALLVQDELLKFYEWSLLKK